MHTVDVDRSDHTGCSDGSDGSNGGGGGGDSGVSSPTGVVAAASPADVRAASPPLNASAAPPPIAVITFRRSPTTCTCSRGCVRLIDEEGPVCSSCTEDPLEDCLCDQMVDSVRCCPPADAVPSQTTLASQCVDCNPEPDVRSQPPLPLLVAAPGAATETKRAFLAARPECPAREPVRILAFEKVQPTYPAPN